MTTKQDAILIENVVKQFGKEEQTGIILIPVGLYVFERAEKHAKRTGKLARNG